MILQTIISIGILAFKTLLIVFPNPDSSTLSSITQFNTEYKDILATSNWIFPIDLFITMLNTVLAIELLIFSIKTLFWIANLVSVHLIPRFDG